MAELDRQNYNRRNGANYGPVIFARFIKTTIYKVVTKRYV